MGNIYKHHNKKTYKLNINDVKLLINKKIPPGWSRVNSSKNSWVAKYNDKLYFKLFLKRSVWERIKAILRGSRAKRFVRESERLRKLGFGAPQCISYSSEWFTIITGNSWVITIALEGEKVLSYWCNTIIYRSVTTRRLFLKALAKEVARLHNKGIIHGDLGLDNILVIELSINKWKFFFLDNERNKIKSKELTWLLRCKNIIQINPRVHKDITYKDRLIFFIEYCKYSKLTKHDRKKLLYQVIEISNKRIKRKYDVVLFPNYIKDTKNN